MNSSRTPSEKMRQFNVKTSEINDLKIDTLGQIPEWKHNSWTEEKSHFLPSSLKHLIPKNNKTEAKISFLSNCQLVHVTQFIFISSAVLYCSSLARLLACLFDDQIIFVIISVSFTKRKTFKSFALHTTQLDSNERVYIFPRNRSLSPYHKFTDVLDLIFSFLSLCTSRGEKRTKNSPFFLRLLALALKENH